MSRASCAAQCLRRRLEYLHRHGGADQDARAAIRRVRRQNPEARIVVTGCYAQRAPEEIAALPGVESGRWQLAQTSNWRKSSAPEISVHNRSSVQASFR